MAEALFPYVGLPGGALLIMIGAASFTDLLAVLRGSGPDVQPRPRNRFAAWLLSQARLNRDEPPSVPRIVFSVVFCWGVGTGILVVWLRTVTGTL